MGHDLATEEIQDFLNQLSQQFTQPVKLYLLGGSALCFLGSPRRTVDIDFFVEDLSVEFENNVEAVARELKIEYEVIAIDEFIPLPADSTTRHRALRNYGSIEVFIYDPYSIALSKLARGFDSDVQDVLFLLQIGIIEINILTKFVEDSLPVAWDYDIDPNELMNYLEVVKNLYM